MPRRRSANRELDVAADAVTRLMATRRGRWALAGLLVLLLIGLGIFYWKQTHPAPPAAVARPALTTAPGEIRIATWNLRKFSEREGLGQNPPDLVMIAKIIRENHFDLLAIQEVQREGQAVERLRRQLGEPWRHAITGRTGNNERYAFLWRADRIEALDLAHLIVDPAVVAAFDRAPAEASFRAGSFDFTLLTVHLWYGDSGSNAKRRAEAAALANLSARLVAQRAEKDLIVMGDFNEFHGPAGNLGMFEQSGWKRLISSPTNLGGTEDFDNVLIDPVHTREWVEKAGVVAFDETYYGNDDDRARADVSDHRPAWAQFATGGADDD